MQRSNITLGATHVIGALGQVQQLRQAFMDKQLFAGFSGPVRAISGSVALVAALIMMHPAYPYTIKAHLLGWGAVFLVASVLNIGAIAYWYLNDPLVKGDIKRLKPTLDVLPPLFVGAVLTFAFIINKEVSYLFGVWMCMFGLTNLASRYVLPPGISYVGMFYVVAGVICILAPFINFLNPLSMGIVFFTGEWISGIILHVDRRRYAEVCNYLKSFEGEREERENSYATSSF